MCFAYPTRWVRKIFGILFLCVMGGYSWADTVTPAMARRAVANWVRARVAFGETLAAVDEGTATMTFTNGVPFHVVSLRGGGFVVTSSDTAEAPVVAYAARGKFTADARNPLWALLRGDAAERARLARERRAASRRLGAAAPGTSCAATSAKWTRWLADDVASVRTLAAAAGVTDLRVAPFVKSAWGQESCTAGLCYNLKTPNNYPCGCVATVGAQIMRYFEWPRATVATHTCTHCTVDGVKRSLTTAGGTYDWSAMPLDPNAGDGATLTQRQAIGKLTSDVGILCGMDYYDGASSTGGYMLKFACDRMGYSHAGVFLTSRGVGNDDMRNGLLSNFDARLPVLIGISDTDTNSGHAVLGDGYGFIDETLYLHLNYGWDGDCTAWYAPPDFSAGGYAFNALSGFVYNIYTNQAADLQICSGRILSEEGVPVPGAQVSSGSQRVTTDANGIYALYLAAGTHTVQVASGDARAVEYVTIQAGVDTSLPSESDAHFGSYSDSVTPVVGNRWGNDLYLSSLVSVATPCVTPGDCLFCPATNVTVTCATAGAVLRYTVDGSIPDATSMIFPAGGMTVTDDTTLRVRAFKDGMNPSPVVTAVYTYDRVAGSARGDFFARPIAIAGNAGTYTIDDITLYTEETDEPRHTLAGNVYYPQDRTVWFRWKAPADGTVCFTTRSEEPADDDYVYYNPTMVAVYTGERLSTLTRLAYALPDGESEFYTSTTESIAVTRGTVYYIVGIMAATATFQDGGGNEYDVDIGGSLILSWSGDFAANVDTAESPVSVPYAWLDRYYPGWCASDDAYEALAVRSGSNGYGVWESYLLGLDPTNALSRLRASIRFEGTQPVIEWNVTNDVETFGYVYKLEGTVGLSPVDWGPTNATHRFFRVVVEPR